MDTCAASSDKHDNHREVPVYLTLLTEHGEEKCDVQLQDLEMMKRIMEGLNRGTHDVKVVVLSALGIEKVIQVRED